jgi:hypothetical protein
MLEKTKGAIDSNLTLDDDKSALARLKRELMGILESHSRTNQQFQEEVKVAIGKLITRREEAARSTLHGKAFEDVVWEFIERYAQDKGDVAERVGEKVGQIKNRKYGDCLIELGPDCTACGAKIVVEAKEEARYSLTAAREEIELARKNRGAEVGLFVFSKKTAPSGLDPVARYGNDVFVVWDAEEAGSDLFFQVGLTLAKALSVRASQRSEAQAADFAAIEAAILDIEKQADSLGEITTSAETIKSSTEKILKRVELARGRLSKHVVTLQEKMADLKGTVAGREGEL